MPAVILSRAPFLGVYHTAPPASPFLLSAALSARCVRPEDSSAEFRHTETTPPHIPEEAVKPSLISQ
jgi:hypothetical protein